MRYKGVWGDLSFSSTLSQFRKLVEKKSLAAPGNGMVTCYFVLIQLGVEWLRLASGTTALPAGFTLTFRHLASCFIGPAFRYSPENAFYVFNQQIYFII